MSVFEKIGYTEQSLAIILAGEVPKRSMVQVDVNKILGAVTSSGLSKGLLGGAAGGLLAGSLMSKKGRKTAKSVAKVGGASRSTGRGSK